MAKSLGLRPYDAKDVFQSALGFSTTCDFLGQQLNPKTNQFEAAMMGHPIIAMSALTLELLLKTLHALHSENPVPALHHLGNLYRGLPQSDRIAVQKRWLPIYSEWHERWDQIRIECKVEGQTPKKVESALDEGAKAFEQSRYQFDPGGQSFNYYLDYLRKPLIGLIAERRPDLSIWRVASNPMSWEELARKTRPSPGERS